MKDLQMGFLKNGLQFLGAEIERKLAKNRTRPVKYWRKRL